MTITPDRIDRANAEAIAAAPVLVEPSTGRRRILALGGSFTRSITGWVFCFRGQTVTVTVPSTIAALEARDAAVPTSERAA